jgi:anti-sigma B factor antagonist
MEHGGANVRTVLEDGPVMVAVVSGSVDARNADAVKTAFGPICARTPKKLIVSLEEVTSVDSSGLGVLVNTYHQVREAGGTLVLCALPERIHRVLTVTSLDKLFTIYDTQAEALSA